VFACLANVNVLWDVRPAPSQYISAGHVNLALKLALQTGGIEAEVAAASASEQRAVGHRGTTG
jgi:hypothetical protein